MFCVACFIHMNCFQRQTEYITSEPLFTSGQVHLAGVEIEHSDSFTCRLMPHDIGQKFWMRQRAFLCSGIVHLTTAFI